MITIRYRGRLGNKLFEYGYARIAAEARGIHLPAFPIKGFPGTLQPVPGRISEGEPYVPKQRELPESLPVDRPITIGGYYQQWETMLRWQRQLREWLSLPHWPERPHENDVVVSVRLGDYLGVPEDPRRFRRAIPSFRSFYEPVFQKLRPRRVYVISDEPSHPYITTQFSHARIISLPPIDGLRFMASFRRVLIPQSTFGWWGAFLSARAQEVYLPMPAKSPWMDHSEQIWPCSIPGWIWVTCHSIVDTAESWRDPKR